MPTTVSAAISEAAKASRAEAIQIISEALSAYISREEQTLLEHKIRVAFQMNEWRIQLITLSEKPLPPNSADLSQIIYKTGTLEKNLLKAITQVLNPEKDPRDLTAVMTSGRILSNAAQSPHTSNVLGPFATPAPGPFAQTKTSESPSTSRSSEKTLEILSSIAPHMARKDSCETISPISQSSLNNSPQPPEDEEIMTITDKQRKILMKASLRVLVASGQLLIPEQPSLKKTSVQQNTQAFFVPLHERLTKSTAARREVLQEKGRPTGTRNDKKAFLPVTAKQSSPTAITKHRPGKTG